MDRTTQNNHNYNHRRQDLQKYVFWTNSLNRSKGLSTGWDQDEGWQTYSLSSSALAFPIEVPSYQSTSDHEPI